MFVQRFLCPVIALAFLFVSAGSADAQRKAALKPTNQPITLANAATAIAQNQAFLDVLSNRSPIADRSAALQTSVLFSREIKIHPDLLQLFVDNQYDYLVQWAEPFAGKSEFIVEVRFEGASAWAVYHRMDWCGSVDHGGPCDRGEWVTGTRLHAEQKGTELLEDGEIIDFRVVERPFTPEWEFLQRFDERAPAETFAEAMELAAETLGEPRVTRILMVSE